MAMDERRIHSDERDHQILVKGFMRASREMKDCLHEWMQTVLVELTSSIDMLEFTAKGSAAKTLRELRDRLNEINLKDLRETMQAVDEAKIRLENREYSGPLAAHTILTQESEKLVDLAWEIHAIRSSVNSIWNYENSDD